MRLICLSFVNFVSHHTLHIFLFIFGPFHVIDVLLEISRCFGTDSTAGGIGFQFRRIKAGAQLQLGALAAGLDPKDVDFFDPKGGKGS